MPPLSNALALQEQLSHVLWIGGPPDAGKTSLAERLAERHGLQVYHFDRHERAHFARADIESSPALYRAHPERMSTEMRWLSSSPQVMAEETIACWSERFWMAVEDILTLPPSPGVIAEGPGFFPECLAPIITDRSQAIWLLPSAEFKFASAIRRDKPGSRWETSDPDRAQRNLIERDLLLGEHVRRQAHRFGLTVYDVDGSRDLEQMAADVAAHFKQRLPADIPNQDPPAV